MTLVAALLVAVLAVMAIGLAPAVYADEAADATSETTGTVTTVDAPAEATSTEVPATTDEEAAAASADATEDAAVTTSAKVSDDAYTMGNDYLLSGRDMTLTAHETANDILGVGETITINDSHAGGSIRLAGRIINLTNTVVDEAITLAGYEVKVNGGSANVVALSGETVTFTGTTSELWAAARKVVIDGTITGNVHIAAGSIEIGPNAVIDGTLSGEVGEKPTIAEGATIANNQLKISKDEQEPTDFKSMLNPIAIAISVLSTILIALLAEWVAGGHTAGAANLVKGSVLGYLGACILGAIVVPLLIVLLCVPVVTIPASLAAILVLLAIALVSTGFTSAALGRLIMPGMGRYKAAALMGLVIGLLCALPYVAAPARGIVFLFMLGYVVRSLRLAMIERREARLEEAVHF